MPLGNGKISILFTQLNENANRYLTRNKDYLRISIRQRIEDECYDNKYNKTNNNASIYK